MTCRNKHGSRDFIQQINSVKASNFEERDDNFDPCSNHLVSSIVNSITTSCKSLGRCRNSRYSKATSICDDGLVWFKWLQMMSAIFLSDYSPTRTNLVSKIPYINIDPQKNLSPTQRFLTTLHLSLSYQILISSVHYHEEQYKKRFRIQTLYPIEVLRCMFPTWLWSCPSVCNSINPGLGLGLFFLFPLFWVIWSILCFLSFLKLIAAHSTKKKKQCYWTRFISQTLHSKPNPFCEQKKKKTVKKKIH